MLEENRKEEKKEKRQNARAHLRLSIQYEKILPNSMQSMQESLEKLYRNRLIDEGYLKGEGL